MMPRASHHWRFPVIPCASSSEGPVHTSDNLLWISCENNNCADVTHPKQDGWDAQKDVATIAMELIREPSRETEIMNMLTTHIGKKDSAVKNACGTVLTNS